MAQLLCGSGLRLMEVVRLRVKDVGFARREILVREGKGSWCWALLLYCLMAMNVEQVEVRLSAARCAVCKKSQFMIDCLRMPADCEWRGVCTDCRYTFPVHTDTAFYQLTQPDLTYWLKQIACPECRHRGVGLDFRVAMSVRESCYFVTCAACQRQFAARSALEAFE